MNIAFCYESVLPNRGGCETYITDLSRRLLNEGHEVHLYATRWDETRMPAGVQYHAVPSVHGPRFLRPWRFAELCHEAMRGNQHDVSMGFNKTWGQDVLYPQGGLHAASATHNLNKYPQGWQRQLAKIVKACDLSHWSYSRLERKQYLGENPPTIIVNSFMVRRHFQEFYGIAPENIHVVRSAIDPNRFAENDRPRRRLAWRDEHGIGPDETVALFSGINYRLKGLVPLLYAVRELFAKREHGAREQKFRLVVTGHPNYRKYLRLAQQLGIADAITFVGHCGDMRNAYFASDFLVHPTFYDPCSLVVLEAFACSLPVITTRANGASELMHPLQEGYVIDDPHDGERLAWAMAQLLDPVRRKSSAQAARKAALGWTFDHHYQSLLNVFQTVAAKRNQAA